SLISLAQARQLARLVINYEPVTATLSDVDIKTAVDLHNEFRRSVKPTASNMIEVAWDPALARVAREFTQKCEYNGFLVLKPLNDYSITGYSSVGRNTAIFGLSEAITGWANERHRYTYGSNHCPRYCGNYKQIIWAETYAVGCSITACKEVFGPYNSGPRNLIVCNYGPGSSWSTPYISGPSASACPTGYRPKNKLCSN
uniref:SCP domain-containing protein n=1 Tax=Ciona intestinalis TaxID=7719 RepID=F6ZH80_CIOIN